MSQSPEQVIFQAVATRERKARDSAAARTKEPLPVSAHHFHNCHYCGDLDKRGIGMIRKREHYTRADGEPLLFIPTWSLCPACNGHGYQLNALGQKYKQQVAA